MKGTTEAAIARLRTALLKAQEETDTLPLTIPSPIRDKFFGIVLKMLSEGPAETSVYNCRTCSDMAFSMALSALGWEDRTAPRPADPKVRMDALIEQMKIAWSFLSEMRHHDSGHE